MLQGDFKMQQNMPRSRKRIKCSLLSWVSWLASPWRMHSWKPTSSQVPSCRAVHLPLVPRAQILALENAESNQWTQLTSYTCLPHGKVLAREKEVPQKKRAPIKLERQLLAETPGQVNFSVNYLQAQGRKPARSSHLTRCTLGFPELNLVWIRTSYRKTGQLVTQKHW